MERLPIGEVARRTGLRTSAVRYYEEAGLLPVPARISGKRVYSADVVQRIGVLRFAQEAGFTLSEIRTLFQGFGADAPLSARWRSLANRKLKDLDALTERIQRMRQALALSLACGCQRIEQCTLEPSDAFAATASPGSATRCCEATS
jgi:MerR family redox-sensitive transcriptional activator SoxR